MRAARTGGLAGRDLPFLIQHAQDARPYALLAAFAAADLLLLVRFVEGRSRRLGVLCGDFCALAVVATHYYGIFFLAGEGSGAALVRPQPLRGWLPAAHRRGKHLRRSRAARRPYRGGVFAGQYVFGVTAMPRRRVVHALGVHARADLGAAARARTARDPSDLPIALAALPAFLVIVGRRVS